MAKAASSLRPSSASGSGITEANFTQATQVATGVPQSPGEEETALIQGLQPCTTYYFAIKSRIDPDGWSCLSNVANPKTGCGGGGFGPLAASPAGAGWDDANTMLPALTGAEYAADQLLIGSPPVEPDSSYHLRLVGGAGQSTRLDELRFQAVDHASSLRAFLNGDHALLGVINPPVHVAFVGANDNLPSEFAAGPGDTVAVDLPPPGGATSPRLLMRLQSGRATFRPDSAGVAVLEPDSVGGWVERWRVYPRALPGDFVVGPLAGSSVRIVFGGATRVVSLGSIAGASATTGVPLALRKAIHSSLGDVTTAVMSADSLSSTLAPGDTLWVRFAAPSASPSLVRDVVLSMSGTTSLLAGAGALRARPEGLVVPIRSALYQSEPNPFSSVTTIRFDLPQRCRVRLAVFDLQGRRVRVVVDQPYEAGRWAAKWDRRDDGGALMRAGIYLYRLEAGRYHGQKKLVLLP